MTFNGQTCHTFTIPHNFGCVKPFLEIYLFFLRGHQLRLCCAHVVGWRAIASARARGIADLSARAGQLRGPGETVYVAALKCLTVQTLQLPRHARLFALTRRRVAGLAASAGCRCIPTGTVAIADP